MRRLSPATIALIALAAIVLMGLVYVFVTRDGGNPDALGDRETAARDGDKPAQRCASRATFDAIKVELFRQAAETRGSDETAFDALARYASVRVERPVLKSRDEGIGTLRCSGRLSLDLPPGVAVVGGRRTLSADIDYVLQPAADNSGDVVILEGAEAIIVPLATLARSGSQPGLPQPNAPAAPMPAPAPATADPALPPSAGPAPQAPAPSVPGAERPAPPRTAPSPPAVQPERASASPSFNCRYARTRGEIAVCRDSGLAALDRQMASQFYRALSMADAGQRVQLQRTRSRFLRYRDSCGSDACIADAYRGRIQEIRDIMAR